MSQALLAAVKKNSIALWISYFNETLITCRICFMLNYVKNKSEKGLDVFWGGSTLEFHS